MRLTNAERSAIAKRLGHGRLKVEQTASGARYKASCECGWGTGPTDPTNATLREAAGRARWHLEKVVAGYLAAENDGVSVPRLAGRRP